MTALVSFERVFEVLDLPSLIEEKPDAVGAAARPPRGSSSTTSRSPTRAPTRSRWPRWRSVARTESRDTGQVLTDIRFVAEPGQMVALVGPSGAGKTTITHLVARLYDVDSGVVRVGGHDVRDVTLQSLEDAVGYVTQDAHMFHDTIRANLLYARPDADRRRDLGGPRGRPDRPPGPVRCPTGSTPSSATAATGSPAASGSGSRSPGCCSRRPRSSCSTRRRPTSTASPRRPSSARSTPRWRGAPRW